MGKYLPKILVSKTAPALCHTYIAVAIWKVYFVLNLFIEI